MLFVTVFSFWLFILKGNGVFCVILKPFATYIHLFSPNVATNPTCRINYR